MEQVKSESDGGLTSTVAYDPMQLSSLQLVISISARDPTATGVCRSMFHPLIPLQSLRACVLYYANPVA